MNIVLIDAMPYESVVHGFKFSIRVKHLTGRDVVVVTCPMCHKSYSVAPHVFYERYHEFMPLEQIAKDFVCKRCGNKHDLRWRVDRATGPEYPRSA